MNRIIGSLRTSPFFGAVIAMLLLTAAFDWLQSVLSFLSLVPLMVVLALGVALPRLSSLAWQKEFRSLVWVWFGFATPLFLLGLTEQGEARWGAALPKSLASLGTAFLGATAFAHEFNFRTADNLLTAPGARETSWRLKFTSSAIMVAGLWLIALANSSILRELTRSRPDNLMMGFSIGVLAIFMLIGAVHAGATWHAIWTRSTLGGAVVGIAAPIGLVLSLQLVDALCGWAFGNRTGTAWTTDATVEGGILVAAFGGLTALSIWRSRGAWVGFESRGDHPMHIRFSGRRVRLGRATLSVLAGLFPLLAKEFRLQRPVFATAIIMISLFIASVGMAQLPGENTSNLATMLAIAILFILASVPTVIAGAISVADERQMGTWEWHLTQPVAFARQWRTKVFVAGVAALVVGWALPEVLFAITQGSLDQSFLVVAIHAQLWPGITASLLGTAIGFLVALWASSFTKVTVQAVVMTPLICTLLFVAASLGRFWGDACLDSILSSILDPARIQTAVEHLDTGAAYNIWEDFWKGEGSRYPSVLSIQGIAWGVIGVILVSSFYGCARWNARNISTTKHQLIPQFCLIGGVFLIMGGLLGWHNKSAELGSAPTVTRPLLILTRWETEQLNARFGRTDARLFARFGLRSSSNYWQLAFPITGPSPQPRGRIDNNQLIRRSQLLMLLHELSASLAPGSLELLGWPDGDIEARSPNIRVIPLPTTSESRRWILENGFGTPEILEEFNRSLRKALSPPLRSL